jgi:hypothetical protein
MKNMSALVDFIIVVGQVLFAKKAMMKIEAQLFDRLPI